MLQDNISKLLTEDISHEEKIKLFIILIMEEKIDTVYSVINTMDNLKNTSDYEEPLQRIIRGYEKVLNLNKGTL